MTTTLRCTYCRKATGTYCTRDDGAFVCLRCYWNEPANALKAPSETLSKAAIPELASHDHGLPHNCPQPHQLPDNKSQTQQSDKIKIALSQHFHQNLKQRIRELIEEVDKHQEALQVHTEPTPEAPLFDPYRPFSTPADAKRLYGTDRKKPKLTDEEFEQAMQEALDGALQNIWRDTWHYKLYHRCRNSIRRALRLTDRQEGVLRTRATSYSYKPDAAEGRRAAQAGFTTPTEPANPGPFTKYVLRSRAASWSYKADAPKGRRAAQESPGGREASPTCPPGRLQLSSCLARLRTWGSPGARQHPGFIMSPAKRAVALLGLAFVLAIGLVAHRLILDPAYRGGVANGLGLLWTALCMLADLTLHGWW